MTGKIHTVGSRAQVWHGTAKKTSGGLTKSDLMMNKHGRIVSKDKYTTAKREMRLKKHGYGTKKGHFGFVKKGSRKMHGGMQMYPLSPANISAKGSAIDGSPLLGDGIAGAGITTGDAGSANLQVLAGMAGGAYRSKSKSKSKSMYGGMQMYPLSPAPYTSQGNASSGWKFLGDGIAGAGITTGDAGSANLQVLAGMSGGAYRSKSKSKSMKGGAYRSKSKSKSKSMYGGAYRSKSKSKSKSMYGGTTKENAPFPMGSPQWNALNQKALNSGPVKQY
jgi:hypothetical protein